MLDEALLNGACEPAFEPVRHAFARIAAEEPGLSAQLCIYHRGVQVVDLWTGPEVSGDSLTAVYSVSKGAAYLVVALLIQDGLINPDAPVADYWPELVAARDQSFPTRLRTIPQWPPGWNHNSRTESQAAPTATTPSPTARLPGKSCAG
jgi:CubicO group peptidase (beta-lactamase class C family)